MLLIVVTAVVAGLGTLFLLNDARTSYLNSEFTEMISNPAEYFLEMCGFGS
jgi:hypothetical protein